MAVLLQHIHTTPEIVPLLLVGQLAAERKLVAGANIEQLKTIIGRYRTSLYPESVSIDMASADRVRKAHIAANILKPGAVDLSTLMDTAVLGG